MSALPRDPNALSFSFVEGALCAQHPSVFATCVCADCGTPMCGTCAFDQSDGSRLCANCAQHRATAPPPILAAAARVTAGVRCVQHPHLQATGQCKTCGAFMCDTCAFDLPGGIKVCPACATAPRSALSPKRKKYLIGSFALASWCTVVMGALFAGAFSGFAETNAGEQAFGMLLMVVLVIPSIIGLALGVSSTDRRLANTMAMWIAIVWNALILGGFMLLMIVGLFAK